MDGSSFENGSQALKPLPIDNVIFLTTGNIAQGFLCPVLLVAKPMSSSTTSAEVLKWFLYTYIFPNSHMKTKGYCGSSGTGAAF